MEPEGKQRPLEITVEVPRCVGAGNCVDIAPKYFDQDPATGIVALHPVAVDPADESQLREAADLCPVAAIHLQRLVASTPDGE